MQAKIISRVRTFTEEEHATDPGQTGTETKVYLRISLADMPSVLLNHYYRGPSTGWVPNYATVTEVLSTGYGDDHSHYRVVRASGFLLKKDGTVGKLAADDIWRTDRDPLDPGSMASMPTLLHSVLTQVVPAFQKGILPNAQS